MSGGQLSGGNYPGGNCPVPVTINVSLVIQFESHITSMVSLVLILNSLVQPQIVVKR